MDERTEKKEDTKRTTTAQSYEGQEFVEYHHRSHTEETRYTEDRRILIISFIVCIYIPPLLSLQIRESNSHT